MSSVVRPTTSAFNVDRSKYPCRASAGVFGDESARIFCQSLDAELLSIAGLYQTSESLDPLTKRQSVQVFLRGDRLCVEALGQPHTRDRSGP